MTIAEQAAAAAKELAETKAALAKLQEEHDGLKKSSADALIAANAALDAGKAQLAKEKQEYAEALQKGAELLAKDQAAHKATADQLAQVKQALENPAFAHAAMTGLAKTTAEGGVPASEQAQADGFQSYAEAHAAYLKITDAKEREAFRAKHAEILKLK